MRPGEKVKQSEKKRKILLQPFWSVNILRYSENHNKSSMWQKKL